MLVDQKYKPEAPHVLFVGTDIEEKRYTYIEENEELGEIYFFPTRDKEIYIDFLSVKEAQQRKGIGTRMIKEFRTQFPNVQNIWGYATEEVLEGFWEKQPGYQFFGEGHGEHEGYYIFELKNKASE